MRIRTTVLAGAFTATLGAVAFAGWLTRDAWLPRPAPPAAQAETEEGHALPRGDAARVRLSPQARANLRLVVKPVRAQTYWRTVEVPGAVAERRGKSDRGVTAPL